jgi:hypothetical protein
LHCSRLTLVVRCVVEIEGREFCNNIESDADSEQPRNSDEDGWEQVGRGNKSSTMAEAKVNASLISSVFSCRLKSTVRQQGAKASATVQPYTCLPLDIELDSVRSVEQALQLFMSSETVTYSDVCSCETHPHPHPHPALACTFNYHMCALTTSSCRLMHRSK